MMLFGNLCKVHAAAAAVVVCCIAYALKVMHHRCSLHYHHRLQVLNDHIHSDTVTCGYRTEGDIVIAGTASPIIAASSVRSLRNEAIRPVHTVVLASLSLLLSGVTVSSSQSSSAASSSSQLYTELQDALSDFSSLDEGDFSLDDFYRLDESSDDIFYSNPRFVEHINPSAVKALTAFHGKVLTMHSMKGTSIGSGRRLNVLDLCSSWVSHVPVEGIQFNRFVGLGMNRQELDRNSQLTERRVQDLNKDSSLSTYSDASFDAVLLQLSIDYLVHPVEVLRDVSRVLVPGGLLIIRYSIITYLTMMIIMLALTSGYLYAVGRLSFSNRVFIDKAVAIWTGKSDIDHIELVGRYLLRSEAAFEQSSAKAYDLLPSSKSDKVFAVVVATRKVDQTYR